MGQGALGLLAPFLLALALAPLYWVGPGGRLEPGAPIRGPALVNLWSTWCPPCRAEMPLLAEYARRGYPVVFLNAGEDPAWVWAYLEGLGLSGSYGPSGPGSRWWAYPPPSSSEGMGGCGPAT